VAYANSGETYSRLLGYPIPQNPAYKAAKMYTEECVRVKKKLFIEVLS
jgi:hypothetical protein